MSNTAQKRRQKQAIGEGPITRGVLIALALAFLGVMLIAPLLVVFIEAFGRGVPELAAATRVWRDFFTRPEEVYSEGHRLIRDTWMDTN